MAKLGGALKVCEERLVCCFLSGSDSWSDADRDPATAEIVFLCRHTRSAVGPDGRVVDEEVCIHGRECFEHSGESRFEHSGESRFERSGESRFERSAGDRAERSGDRRFGRSGR